MVKKVKGERLACDNFPFRLLYARKLQHMNQGDLSFFSGWSAGGVTVSSYETGARTPNMPNVCRLARALNVSPAWLVFGEGSMNDVYDNYGEDKIDSFSDRLYDAVRESGMTYKELAGKIGKDISYISRYTTMIPTRPYRGTVRMQTIERLANALNIPAGWLAFGDCAEECPVAHTDAV